MKVELTFTAEDDDGDLGRMDGYHLTMTGLDKLSLSTPADITQDTDGKRTVLPTGTLKLRAHGQHAIWDKGSEKP